MSRIMNGHYLLVLLFSGISASASGAQDIASNQGSASANKELVRRFYGEVFGRWNLTLVDTVMAPTFVGHDMPANTPPGPAERWVSLDLLGLTRRLGATLVPPKSQ